MSLTKSMNNINDLEVDKKVEDPSKVPCRSPSSPNLGSSSSYHRGSPSSSNLGSSSSSHRGSPSSCHRQGRREKCTNCVGIRIDVALACVEECLKDEQILVDPFIDFYSELRRMFEAAGSLYSFVGTEIYGKAHLMRKYRQGENGDRYRTVESSVLDLRDRPEQDCPSAAGTLLRLHRPVDFLSKGLRMVSTYDSEENTGLLCRKLYNATLAKHHTKLVRKTVNAVIVFWPTNNYIIKRLVGSDRTTQEHLLATLPALCDRLDALYQATEKIFAKYDMLDIR